MSCISIAPVLFVFKQEISAKLICKEIFSLFFCFHPVGHYLCAKFQGYLMSFKRLLSLLILVFTLSGVTIPAFAEETNAAEPKKEGFNASETIFGHIRDAHDWHFFTIEHEGGEPTHVSIPLPVIIYSKTKGVSVFMSSALGEEGHRDFYKGYKLNDENGKIVSEDATEQFYDFSITKNVTSMLIAVILLLWIMLSVAGKYKKNGVMKAPTGMQNALEPVITFIRDEVAKPNLGSKYMKFMPLLLTVFFFIWINNLLGLLPGGANFTGNIAVTACLALVSFIVMIANSNKHFWSHLVNPPGVPHGIRQLLALIEIMSLFIKPIALMIRLFANMLAGHIVILSVICMIFIFGSLSKIAGWGFVPVSLAFSIFMFMLELLVAAIQAFIFANLTAVFLGQSMEGAHDDHEHAVEGAHH